MVRRHPAVTVLLMLSLTLVLTLATGVARGRAAVLGASPSLAARPGANTRIVCSTWYSKDDFHPVRRGPVFHLRPGAYGRFDYEGMTVKFHLINPDHEIMTFYARGKNASGQLATGYEFARGKIHNTYATTKQGFTGLVAMHNKAGASIQYICHGTKA
jgi:hypothetical protein